MTYAAVDTPAGSEAPRRSRSRPSHRRGRRRPSRSTSSTTPAASTDIVLGVIGRLYTYDPVHGDGHHHRGRQRHDRAPADRLGLRLHQRLRLRHRLRTTAATPSTAARCTRTPPTIAATPASYPLMTAPQMFTLGGNFYTFDQDIAATTSASPATARPIRSTRTSSRSTARSTSSTQRAAQHGGRWRQRLHDDVRQQPVRHRRCAVHDRAQGGLAQRRDDLRPVQHHAGQRRRHRELRLPARHAERTDRRQRHDLSADDLRLYLHHHDGRPQLHRHHQPNATTVTIGGDRLPDQATPPSSATA